MRTANCGLQIADCGLRTADCGLRIADCGKDRVPRIQPYFDLNFNINFWFFMSKYVFGTHCGVSIINVHAFGTAN